MILWGIGVLFFASFCLADSYVRQPSVDVLLYDIAIEFTDASDSITGDTRIHVRMQDEKVAAMHLDFAGMQIDSVRMDGIERAYSYQNDRLSVEFGRTYSKNEIAVIEVGYHGKPGNKGMWIGENQYHRRVLFTNNWPNYAHYWFPAIDHPYDKAMVNVSVTAPAKYEVISNGLRAGNELLRDGRKITRWKEIRPIPTYCIAIAIAEFSISPKKESAGTPFQWYAFSEDAQAAARKFHNTRSILNYFKNLIGPFPYEKLAQVQASIPFDGMENASAIFYSETLFKDKLGNDDPMPHEIAHQWFGDSVTVADWDELWLSEGFASYFEPGDEIAEVAVDCARLDDFTGPNRRYAYVKIDVEGAELLVLRGARQTIDRDRPLILFESSHNGAPRLGLSREGLFAYFIEELQYNVFLVGDFLEKRSPLNLAGFHKAAEYPFQAFNFLAISREGIRQSD